ncbi:MAG: hypothetical protein JWR21_4458 [Herminiimonas sp.]|nr:hypothetical protein [Herminiimonas sp.]
MASSGPEDDTDDFARLTTTLKTVEGFDLMLESTRDMAAKPI